MRLLVVLFIGSSICRLYDESILKLIRIELITPILLVPILILLQPLLIHRRPDKPQRFFEMLNPRSRHLTKPNRFYFANLPQRNHRSLLTQGVNIRT